MPIIGHLQRLQEALKRSRMIDMNHTILRLPAVKARTGLSRSTIYSMVKNGTFPAPVKLGARAVGWVAASVDDLIASRIATREAALNGDAK